MKPTNRQRQKLWFFEMKKKNGKNKPGFDDINESKAGYDYHLPVMLSQSCDLLVTKPDGIYVDGTLGGGGHSAEILSRLAPEGRLYSFDKDPEAIQHCSAKFADELSKGTGSRITIINDCFSKATELKDFRGELTGVLLDLGLSSRQLDNSRRGFSHRANSHIDMRFSSHGGSAEELLNAAEEEELESIFRNYGEEQFSKLLARRISQIRRVTPLRYTYELRAIVEDVVPGAMLNKSLSRVFQALRIAVNNELEVLAFALDSFLKELADGGRIVVLSYHSLEDRIVKQFIKSHSKLSKNINIEVANSVPVLKALTAKPIEPPFSEIKLNPRARSAKLRAAEKIGTIIV